MKGYRCWKTQEYLKLYPTTERKIDPVSLDVIHSTLKSLLPYEFELLNVYIIGSRAYGLSLPHSDYDFIVIISSKFNLPGLCALTSPCSNFNLNVYHLDYFLELIRENIVWMVLVLFLPARYVLLEKVRPPLIISKFNLNRGVLLDSEHNLSKAKGLFKNKFQGPEVTKGKKNVIHGIRYLYYGIQLMLTDKIYDPCEGNEYWWKIMQMTSLEWHDYLKEYKPIYDKLTNSFKNLVKPKALIFTVGETGQPQGQLEVLKYAQKFGVYALTRELNIYLTIQHQSTTTNPDKTSTIKSLISAFPDVLAAPEDHPVVQDCENGLVFELTQNTNHSFLTLVSYPCYTPCRLYSKARESR